MLKNDLQQQGANPQLIQQLVQNAMMVHHYNLSLNKESLKGPQEELLKRARIVAMFPKQKHGMCLVKVMLHGPAAEAGLTENDVIFAVNNQIIPAVEAEAIQLMQSATAGSNPVTFRVYNTLNQEKRGRKDTILYSTHVGSVVELVPKTGPQYAGRLGVMYCHITGIG